MRVAGFRIEVGPKGLVAKRIPKVGGEVQVHITFEPRNPETVRVRAYFTHKRRWAMENVSDKEGLYRIPLGDAVSARELEELKTEFLKHTPERVIFFRRVKLHPGGPVWN